MRAFRFSLQSVLALRQLEEKGCQTALAKARAALEAATAALAALTRERLALEDRVRASLHDRQQIATVLPAQNRLAELERLILRQQQVAEERQAEFRQRLEEYRTCRRRREALERMREQAWQEYRVELARAEQTEIDELGARPSPLASRS